MSRVELWLLSAAVSFALTASGAAIEQCEDRGQFDKLARATEQASALMNTRGVSLDSLQGVTRTGCRALEQLLSDDTFYPCLQEWVNEANEDSTATRQRESFRTHLYDFLFVFAHNERQLLVDAGLTEKAATDLITAAASFRESLNTELNAEELLSNVRKLKDELCEGEATLREAKGGLERRRLFGRWTLGLGGTALIVFDGVSSLPSGGVAAASMAIGGAMVGSALSK